MMRIKNLFQTKKPMENSTLIMLTLITLITMIHQVVIIKDYRIYSLQYLMVMAMIEGKDSSPK
jgi:hypothetical protein